MGRGGSNGLGEEFVEIYKGPINGAMRRMKYISVATFVSVCLLAPFSARYAMRRQEEKRQSHHDTLSATDNKARVSPLIVATGGKLSVEKASERMSQRVDERTSERARGHDSL